jgi:hypothetical protein
MSAMHSVSQSESTAILSASADAGPKSTWCIQICAIAVLLAFTLHAEEPAHSPAIPIIPPSVSSIAPAGMERGGTAAFAIEGRNLSEASEVLFDAPGMSGRVTQIADVAEKIAAPRAGEDLGAQVPLGKKQTAKLELTIAKDVRPGIHRFRIKTPLGTTNTMGFAVGGLPEIEQSEKSGMKPDAAIAVAQLPVTWVGNIAAPGTTDSYEFDGRNGDELVFAVVASRLGSDLRSTLELKDNEGRVIASAGKNDVGADVTLHSKLTHDGRYTVSIGDRDRSGGKNYFYRLDAGALSYVTSFFPLGVSAGVTSTISVKGLNLGGANEVRIAAPIAAEGWTTTPLKMGDVQLANEVNLAVGSGLETAEHEPNNSIAEAQTVPLPITINGRIDGGMETGSSADEDYFRFRAHKGEQVSIDVAASRLGSALDSVIEVLDAEGYAIPRATIRCLNQTTTTLSDRDSRTTGIRLNSTSDLQEGDYLMVGDELNRIDSIPDQPDADTNLKGIDDLRLAYLGTSPDVHAVNTPVYKVKVLQPGAEPASNGLPVFHLTWRNDDGGPGYGADSMLDFVAPADGEYLLHVKDVRGMEGADFAYRLTLRDAVADYRLKAEPENPNIPRGGSTVMTVSVIARRGELGPIAVEVKGLPMGVTASTATIEPGQDSTVVVLSAAANAPLDAPPSAIEIVGHEKSGMMRMANASGDRALQVVSITPAPDVVVTTEARQVSIEPGKEVTVTLHIDRHNGFKGRVPCFVQNLPPGVRVVNVGLNGVLVTEAQSSRTFTLKAEDWAEPIQQPIYVVGVVESNSPTMHPSAPVLLNIALRDQAAMRKVNTDESSNR